MIRNKINNILYSRQEKLPQGYGIKLLGYYLIEQDIEKLLREELKSCYKDVKELSSGKYSDEEFEAWYTYKYKEGEKK